MVIVAPLLLILLLLIVIIYGFIEPDELSDVELLIIMFVTLLPTSAVLHADANYVSLTLSGGYRTSYVGSRSKQTVIEGVVRLWIIVYTLVNVNCNVNGGGTTNLLWVIVNEKFVCCGIMLMILGAKLKFEKCYEYWVSVWFDYSAIFINRVIWVDEGNENYIGTTTGYPIVETDIDGIFMVGLMKVEDDELTTCTVVGRIFLKYVCTCVSNLSKFIV